MEEFINRAKLLCSLDPPVLATSSLNNWIHGASTYKRRTSCRNSCRTSCRTCRSSRRTRLNPRRRLRWISRRTCPWLITGRLGIAAISWAIAVNAFAIFGKFGCALAGSGLAGSGLGGGGLGGNGLGGSGLAIWCPDKIIRIRTVLRTRSGGGVLGIETSKYSLLYGELRQAEKYSLLYGELGQTQKYLSFRIAVCQECSFDLGTSH